MYLDVARTVYTGAIQGVHVTFLLVLLLGFPLAGACLLALFGRRWPARAARVIGAGGLAGAAALAIAAAARLAVLPAGERFLSQRLWPFLHVGALQVDFALALDPFAATLALLATVVGLLVALFAVARRADQGRVVPFLATTNLLMFALLLLLTGDALPTLAMGEAGVGVAIWLLAGGQDERARRAADRALLTGLASGVAMLGGMALLFWGQGGTWSERGYAPETAQSVTVDAPTCPAGIDLKTLGDRPHEAKLCEIPVGPTLVFRELADAQVIRDRKGERPFRDALAARTVWGAPLATLVMLLFLVAAAARSAQLPLAGWLPDATAWPAPASVLIRATTTVAGVYLLARLGPLLVLSPLAMTVIALVGVATAAWGALAAMVQHDLQRLLAFLSASQLGLAFLALGTGAFDAALLQLVAHGLLAACLGLAAGVIEDRGAALREEQPGAAGLPTGFDARRGPRPGDARDLRLLGGLAPLLPRTRLAALVGCLGFAGLPAASGFFAQDAVLAHAFASRGTFVLGPALWAAAVVAIGLTSFAAFRAYYLAFFGRPLDAATGGGGAATGDGGRAAGEGAERASRLRPVLLLAGLGVLAGPLLGWPAAWGGQQGALGRMLGSFLDEPTLARLFRPLGAGALGLEAVVLAAAAVGWLGARALYRDAAATRVRRERLQMSFDAVHRFVFSGLRLGALGDALVVGPVQDLVRAVDWVEAKVLRGAPGGGGPDNDAQGAPSGAGGGVARPLRLRRLLAIALGAAALLAIVALSMSSVSGQATGSSKAAPTGASPAAAAGGDAGGRLAFSSGAVTFSRRGEEQPVLVRNLGRGPLRIEAVRTASASNLPAVDFTPTAVALPRVLAAGETLALGVSYRSSSATRQAFGALLVQCDDPTLPVDPLGAVNRIEEQAPPQRLHLGSLALRAGSTWGLLSWIIFLPLVGAGVLAVAPNRRTALLRKLALGASAAPFVLALLATTGLPGTTLVGFEPGVGAAAGNHGLQFVEHLALIRRAGLEYYLGVDGLSWPLLLLVTLLSLVAMAVSRALAATGGSEQDPAGQAGRGDGGPPAERSVLALLLLLETGMSGALCAVDFVLFMAFLELVLMAACGLVLVAGGPGREQVGRRLFGHGLAASALLVAALVVIHAASPASLLVDGTPVAHTFDLMKLGRADLAAATPVLGVPFAHLAFALLFIAFATLLPVPPLHSWRRGLVGAAPPPASLLISGGLAAIGVYGMARIAWPVVPDGARWASGAVALLGAAGVAYAAAASLAGRDLRQRVGHLSCAQLGCCLLGLSGATQTGYAGALFAASCQGLLTALLLVLVAVSRQPARAAGAEPEGSPTAPERTGGVGTGLAFLFALACLASLGLPGLSGFVGPALALLGAFPAHRVIGLGAALGLALAAAAAVSALRQALPVRPTGAPLPWHVGDQRTLLVLLPLAAALIVLGVAPSLLLDLLQPAVHDLLDRVATPGAAGALASLAR